ncbi:MAG: hypothetical protein JWN48_2146 [Myxococcaceae bacterium]|nr:hypothetical protein [Myxococcaceae bacterium]
MCRLFALTAAPAHVSATFWLLEAPHSLVSQSSLNPDGTGLGYFEDGTPVIDKEPLRASEDVAFAREAKLVSSTTFVSHIRFATTGRKTRDNCHPFTMDGRIFAHNGVIGSMDSLEAHLGDDLARVRGQTDSERFFALITKEIGASGGDVLTGIVNAVRWTVEHLPVQSLNFVMTTPLELWALRYPETDTLFIRERKEGGPHGDRPLNYASSSLAVHSTHASDKPTVVVASERLDDSLDWRSLESGELIHVAADLSVTSTMIVGGPPRFRLSSFHVLASWLKRMFAD